MAETYLPIGVIVSIIDNGYGKEHGLYEVAAFVPDRFQGVRYVTRYIWKGEGNVIGWLSYTHALDFLNDAKKLYRR
jgi:hypothetical protein